MIEQAVRIEPNYPLALNNLGVIYSEQGDLGRSGECLEKSVRLDPGNVDALYNLAGVCNALNNFDKARTILNRLVAIAPDHQAANHMLAALSGAATSSAPREYVELTFDKYAGRFDEHIQNTLGYTAPSALADLVRNTVPEALPFAAALDLGCGTGLSGASFRSLVTRLVGVDVSAQMLGKAAAKKLYDRLEHDEIMPFLQRGEERYDLFIAADVFVYLGELQPLFVALDQRSGKDGIVACSIETTDKASGFELLPSGRYAHSPNYLEGCAAAAGFTVLGCKPHDIRREKGAWLPGKLYLLRKNQDNPQTP
jgi:predicted TPR repeat methyltransferase